LSVYLSCFDFISFDKPLFLASFNKSKGRITANNQVETDRVFRFLLLEGM
jgi:hypothetical protein